MNEFAIYARLKKASCTAPNHTHAHTIDTVENVVYVTCDGGEHLKL